MQSAPLPSGATLTGSGAYLIDLAIEHDVLELPADP